MIVLLAFKAWMLVDAVQRCGGRCGGSSYWIIICWVPFGDWAYFFAVKIHDPEFARLWKRILTRPKSLDDLRYAYRTSPSAVNKLTYAQALHDREQFQEALPIAEELLKQEPESKMYQLLVASCLAGLKQPERAIALLEGLIERDLSFRDYEAATTLASLFVREKQPERAIEVYRKIIRSSSQLRYQVNFACLLVEHGQRDEARQILDDAIQQFRHEPRFIQRRDRRELGVAKKVRKSLGGRVAA